MTSLSRRKRPTTARRTTPGRTICSLLGLAWLAAGPAVADPAPLRPLAAPAASTDLREPPPLMPVVKSALPEVKPLVPAKTLYYQKDAAKTPVPRPSAMMPVMYQDPAALQPATPTVPSLPSGALTTEPPGIGQINLLSDADLRRTIATEVDRQYK